MEAGLSVTLQCLGAAGLHRKGAQWAGCALMDKLLSYNTRCLYRHPGKATARLLLVFKPLAMGWRVRQ